MVARTEQAEIAADNAEIDKMRQIFGDAEAAKLAREIYLLRREQALKSSRFPRALIVLLAVWVGLLETADKLPKLLLAFPGYEATLAEYQAKMMQPDLTKAQLARAENEAKASDLAPLKSIADTGIAQINFAYAKVIGKYP